MLLVDKLNKGKFPEKPQGGDPGTPPSLSSLTVKHHISNILSKLGLSSRAQAAVWATQHGLLDDGFPERKAS